VRTSAQRPLANPSPPANRGGLFEADTVDLSFLEYSRTRRAWASLVLFVGCRTPRPRPPARIAIALELLRRAQQVDRCGACAVADGDWCAVLNVVASRGSRWQRVRQRGQRPERPPALRHVTAPALPIARSPVRPQGQAEKASFGAKRLHSYPPPCSRLPGPLRQIRSISYERWLNTRRGPMNAPLQGLD
jgi:hypothetical protein